MVSGKASCSYVLHAGGHWGDGMHCGSVARNANNLRSNVNGNNGGRGSIREIIVSNSGTELKRKVRLTHGWTLCPGGKPEYKAEEAACW